MSVKSDYRQLDSKTRSYRREKRFLEAREIIGEMISLIESNSKIFDEPEDRIRILNARSSMLSYEENRVKGHNVAHYLREAARLSTPTHCINNVCDKYEPYECTIDKDTFSPRQKKMCSEKLNCLSNALKIEAAYSARTFNYTEALEKRRLATYVHSALCASEPTENRIKNQNYLAYWQQITEYYVALMEGNFELSREWLSAALNTARDLDDSKCFPNYFRNIAEIRAHFIFIDAIENIKKGSFIEAKENFIAWLDFDTGSSSKLRRDNIIIFKYICDFLQRIPTETISFVEWESIETLLEKSYVARPTWALWNKLQWIRELAFHLTRQTPKRPSTQVFWNKLQWIRELAYHLFRKTPNRQSEIENEIMKFASEWRLFIPDAILLGEERISGLRRPVNIPSIINVFQKLDKRKHFWQGILYQNIKNLFLIMLEYEILRSTDRSSEFNNENTSISNNNHSVLSFEKITLSELFEQILYYLERRSPKHKNIFEKARPFLKQFVAELNSENYANAVMEQEKVLHSIRFWPHLIYIESVEETKQLVFIDENSPGIKTFWIKAKRLWNTEPKEIIFESPQRPSLHEYYFLRPRWNVRKGEQYRLRHEKFHIAESPRLIEVFFNNIFEVTEDNSTTFQKWIFQFSESERLLVCRLLNSMEIFNEERVRETWAEVFRKLTPEARRTAIFVGIGHGAKSGRLNPYLFRQGVSSLPDYETVFGGREKLIFRDLSEFDIDSLGLKHPTTVVFLDDFIGTGGQAFDFIDWYYAKYEWLKHAKVYLAILVGFEKAINDVKQKLGSKIKDIVAGVVLGENKRAFSPENPIWKNEYECKEAERLVNEIGKKFLKIHVADNFPKQQIYDVERDALGWHNCQALISFPHNIPSNTLPIFWCEGKTNDGNLIPLFHRYD